MVEAAVGEPESRRFARWTGLLIVLAVCAGVLVHFIVSPPGPALEAAGASRTPTGWLHHYADRLHRHLELVAITEYHGGVAYLQVQDGHDRVMITLDKQGGLWKAAQEQGTTRRAAS